MAAYWIFVLLEIGLPEYYEALLSVEAFFDVPVSERSIPTLIVGNQILIGENEIRDNFPGILSSGLAEGGIDFPEIEGLNPAALISISPNATETVDEICGTDEACEVDAPLYIAYFYQTGCDECSRVSADLKYLRSKFPQMQIEEFNIYDSADLATWLTDKLGYEGDFHTPALFIGNDVLVGDELYLENITPILESYEATGTQATWQDFDADEGQQSIIERFSNMGWADGCHCGTGGWDQPLRFCYFDLLCLIPDLERPAGKRSPDRWRFFHCGRLPGLPGCWLGFIQSPGSGRFDTGNRLKYRVWGDRRFLSGPGSVKLPGLSKSEKGSD